jgi:signal transduction histidine kinase
VEWTRVEVAPLLESTLAFLADRFRSRGITVDTDLQGAPTIMADREKLQQLFLNLFLNAVDAMPTGGVLRVALAPSGGDKVEIRVADNGLGIEAQDLDRIFEPFYTTKPAGQGSGLGLVVSHGIVREHDGTIEAISEPGVGTEFRIELPVTTAAESV